MKSKSIFTPNSWLNRTLRKIFNKQIIIHKGCHFYVGSGIKIYDLHKFGYKLLPYIGIKKFVYNLDPQLDVKCQVQSICDGIETQGWVIELRYKKKGCDWYGHWNHKIYDTREDALDALNQTCQSQKSVEPLWRRDENKYEFRILPLYKINQNLHRSIQIKKIIE